MDFEHAKESIAYLSDSQYPDSAFLYRDYIYAASFAADGLDDRAQAIEYYKKAFEKDSTKAERLSPHGHLAPFEQASCRRYPLLQEVS